MKLIINEKLYNMKISLLHLILTGFFIFSFLSLWLIKKSQVVNGYLTLVNINDNCHYVFISNSFLEQHSLTHIIINNEKEIVLQPEDYEFKNNWLLLTVIVSCSKQYYQPASIVFGTQSLFAYLWDILWT